MHSDLFLLSAHSDNATEMSLCSGEQYRFERMVTTRSKQNISTGFDNARPDVEVGAEVQRRATVFEMLAYPFFRSLDPKKVAKFLRERKRFEVEVEERRKENLRMLVALYTVSFDTSLLENLHTIGALDDVLPDKQLEVITSKDIEKYVHSLVEHKEGNTVNLQVIENALKGNKLNMSIENRDARMLEYIKYVFVRLEGAGYDYFKTVNPREKISILQKRVYPDILR